MGAFAVVRKIKPRSRLNNQPLTACKNQGRMSAKFLTIPLLRFLRVRQQTRGNFLFEICTRQHASASQSLSFQGFCEGRVGDSSTVEQRTLTPLILVRIQVPQPGTPVFSPFSSRRMWSVSPGF